MNRKATYHSPLRRAQRDATSERILEACAALLRRGEELTYAAVAAEARVQERTVYRHFPTKERLESAFWWWQASKERGLPGFSAQSPAQLVAAMRASFAAFDRDAALVEAMLASPQGMSIRLHGNEARKKMFLAATAEVTTGLDARARRRAAAAAQVLYSAPSWQMLRRFWDMDGREAAATIELALGALFEGLRRHERNEP